MLINLRNALMAGGKKWKNPYVTDGLVAMWDGEWNAGGGVHKSNPTAIADLVGSVDLNIINNVVIGDNYFTPNLINTLRSSAVLSQKIRSWDICMRDGSGSGAAGQVGIVQFGSDGRGITKYAEWIGVGVLGTYGMMSYSRDAVDLVYSANYNSDENNTNATYYKNGMRSSNRTVNWTTRGFPENTGFDNLVLCQAYFTTCRIYSIRLYSRVRTADEIARNYAIDKARFGLP